MSLFKFTLQFLVASDHPLLPVFLCDNPDQCSSGGRELVTDTSNRSVFQLPGRRLPKESKILTAVHFTTYLYGGKYSSESAAHVPIEPRLRHSCRLLPIVS